MNEVVVKELVENFYLTINKPFVVDKQKAYDSEALLCIMIDGFFRAIDKDQNNDHIYGVHIHSDRDCCLLCLRALKWFVEKWKEENIHVFITVSSRRQYNFCCEDFEFSNQHGCDTTRSHGWSSEKLTMAPLIADAKNNKSCNVVPSFCMKDNVFYQDNAHNVRMYKVGDK